MRHHHRPADDQLLWSKQHNSIITIFTIFKLIDRNSASGVSLIYMFGRQYRINSNVIVYDKPKDVKRSFIKIKKRLLLIHNLS